jgi:hypothetical protein
MCVEVVPAADYDALKASLRNVLESLKRCATELEHVQAVENCTGLCASGEGRAAADEAWAVIADNRP